MNTVLSKPASCRSSHNELVMVQIPAQNGKESLFTIYSPPGRLLFAEETNLTPLFKQIPHNWELVLGGAQSPALTVSSRALMGKQGLYLQGCCPKLQQEPHPAKSTAGHTQHHSGKHRNGNQLFPHSKPMLEQV